MADTLNGETVTPQAPSNEPGNTAVPPVVNSSADVEAAKREAEQAKMRANQLQNELDKFKLAQDEAQRKQLEEKEEFKTLYEQTQSRLREIEESQTANERQAAIAEATATIFKDYSADTIELAKTAGLTLSDSSDAAVASLKEKLDAFQAKVGGKPPTATPNNPRQTAPQESTRQELTARAHYGAESPMAVASAKGDDTVIRSYIKQLPAIERMKEIARNGN